MCQAHLPEGIEIFSPPGQHPQPLPVRDLPGTEDIVLDIAQLDFFRFQGPKGNGLPVLVTRKIPGFGQFPNVPLHRFSEVPAQFPALQGRVLHEIMTQGSHRPFKGLETESEITLANPARVMEKRFPARPFPHLSGMKFPGQAQSRFQWPEGPAIGKTRVWIQNRSSSWKNSRQSATIQSRWEIRSCGASSSFNRHQGWSWANFRDSAMSTVSSLSP